MKDQDCPYPCVRIAYRCINNDVKTALKMLLPVNNVFVFDCPEWVAECSESGFILVQFGVGPEPT